MNKRPIKLLILVLIFNCSYFVAGQSTADESRQKAALSGGAIDEPKVNYPSDKSETIDNKFYQGFYRDERKVKLAQSNNINLQLKPAGEVKFGNRSENSGAEEFPVVSPFNDPTRTICCQTADFLAGANSNLFHKQFYKDQSDHKQLNKLFPERNFEVDKESERSNPADEPDASNPVKKKEKFHWKPAIAQSMIFLGIQHGMRVWRQQKTSKELVGPFFRDWRNSVKNLRGWDDGNKIFTNYIAHPLQGSFTGRIFINNSDKAKKQEFGKSKAYWESRFKALAWSAFWSTQFELGPISEASIGNVGMYDKTGPSKLSWGDLIITPVVGTGVLIAEDAIDKYVLRNWLEKKAGYKVTTKIKIFRSLLTPTTSLANLLRGKPPWKRDNRPDNQTQMGGGQ